MAVEQRTAELFTRLYAMSEPFKVTAYFDREMDQLIYLRTNESYRADRVDGYLTLLWHAYEPQLVGIKLKGFRSIFDQFKEKGLVDESHFIPLCKAISMILHYRAEIHDIGNREAAALRAKFYRRAEELVEDYRIDQSLLEAA